MLRGSAEFQELGVEGARGVGEGRRGAEMDGGGPLRALLGCSVES